MTLQNNKSTYHRFYQLALEETSDLNADFLDFLSEEFSEILNEITGPLAFSNNSLPGHFTKEVNENYWDIFLTKSSIIIFKRTLSFFWTDYIIVRFESDPREEIIREAISFLRENYSVYD